MPWPLPRPACAIAAVPSGRSRGRYPNPASRFSRPQSAPSPEGRSSPSEAALSCSGPGSASRTRSLARAALPASRRAGAASPSGTALRAAMSPWPPGPAAGAAAYAMPHATTSAIAIATTTVFFMSHTSFKYFHITIKEECEEAANEIMKNCERRQGGGRRRRARLCPRPFRLYPPAVRLHQLLHYRQPYPEPAAGPPVEPLEDERQVFFPYPGPVVLNGYLNLSAHLRRRHHDPAPCARRFQRIGQEVQDYLAQPLGVGQSA